MRRCRILDLLPPNMKVDIVILSTNMSPGEAGAVSAIVKGQSRGVFWPARDAVSLGFDACRYGPEPACLFAS